MYKIIIIIFIIFLVFVVYNTYDINNNDNTYDMIWYFDRYGDKYKLDAIDYNNNIKYKIELDCDNNINSNSNSNSNSNYIQTTKPYNSNCILSRGFFCYIVKQKNNFNENGWMIIRPCFDINRFDESLYQTYDNTIPHRYHIINYVGLPKIYKYNMTSEYDLRCYPWLNDHTEYVKLKLTNKLIDKFITKQNYEIPTSIYIN
jgi:hypothetical protein